MEEAIRALVKEILDDWQQDARTIALEYAVSVEEAWGYTFDKDRDEYERRLDESLGGAHAQHPAA